MSVRAKFKVVSVTSFDSSTYKAVKLQAIGADDIPENQRYHKYTPSGSIEILIDNPPASDQLAVGKVFYVDFIEAS